MKWDFIQGPEGKTSFMRVTGLLVVTNIMLVWTWKNLTEPGLVSMGLGEWGVVSSVLFGKVAQVFGESKK